MGGNQDESERSGTHLTPVNLDDRIGNTSMITDPRRHGGLPLPSSRSYFSTLEVPQSFSFEQKFQRSNAMILSDMRSSMSHDRLLSSPSGGNIRQGTSNQLNCASYPNTVVNFNPGQHIREMARGASTTKSERLRKDGSTRSLSSQKRQMYLEKRRHSAPCWPTERRKRCSHSDDDDEGISMQPVRKVFVNEEKMAARFDGLSLSNSLLASSREMDVQRIMDDIDNSLMDSDEEDDEVLSKTDVSGVRRLQISDHLKTALKQSKPEVLPERIVQKIANPCTAMILWQPPDLTPPRRSEQTVATEEVSAERPIPHANLLSSLPEYNPDGADEDMEL